MVKRVLLPALLFALSVQIAQAQRKYTNNAVGWLMYTGTHKIAKKMSLHLEAQIRRNDYFSEWQQLLLRGGLNWHVDKQVMATAGYCFVQTWSYGAFPVLANFPENRIWEQIQLKSQYGAVEFSSRFRLEQRFSNLPRWVTNGYAPGPSVYTNRLRLMNRFSVPLKGKIIEDRSFYITAYDELFVNFGKNVAFNILDQNRASLAMGYRIPKVGRLELGYMNQLLFKPDGIKVENNHTITLSLNATIDFVKQQE